MKWVWHLMQQVIIRVSTVVVVVERPGTTRCGQSLVISGPWYSIISQIAGPKLTKCTTLFWLTVLHSWPETQMNLIRELLTGYFVRIEESFLHDVFSNIDYIHYY